MVPPVSYMSALPVLIPVLKHHDYQKTKSSKKGVHRMTLNCMFPNWPYARISKLYKRWYRSRKKLIFTSNWRKCEDAAEACRCDKLAVVLYKANSSSTWTKINKCIGDLIDDVITSVFGLPWLWKTDIMEYQNKIISILITASKWPLTKSRKHCYRRWSLGICGRHGYHPPPCAHPRPLSSLVGPSKGNTFIERRL